MVVVFIFLSPRNVTAHICAWLTCDDDEKDKKKHLLSHCDLNSAISIALIDLSGSNHNIKQHG